MDSGGRARYGPRRARLLRWRPRLRAQRRAATPRRLPSGAASHLDPSRPPDVREVWTPVDVRATGREGPACFVGALGCGLNVEQLRLAGCLRAPPRIWTLLGRLTSARYGLRWTCALRAEKGPPASLAPSAAGST